MVQLRVQTRVRDAAWFVTCEYHTVHLIYIRRPPILFLLCRAFVNELGEIERWCELTSIPQPGVRVQIRVWIENWVRLNTWDFDLLVRYP